jgi:hypothetical protein
MLDAAPSRLSLASRLEEVSSRMEKAMAEGAYFGALTVLSVVTSLYDNIDFLIIGQGFAAGQMNEDILSCLPESRAASIREEKKLPFIFLVCFYIFDVRLRPDIRILILWC